MNILIVEDDPVTALYVTEGLQSAGHTLYWAPTGPDGLEQARRGDHALVIVDRMLPGLDGLSLVRNLRQTDTRTPVLFLTTMDDLDARVEGLNAGGDDYLTKPFALPELLARVNAIMRRTSRSDEAHLATRLRAGGLAMDLIARRVSRDGRVIELQQQEFKLLEYLVRNAGRTVTRMMLLERVWNLDFDPGTNVVESHMSRLRSKVDRGFDTEMIRTIRGAGYVLHAD
ncbi:MAG TPA: response regulator transcription factor [Rhizomicrobium sp.]|nr:response regulator transcription factor [Rhizomicrobium sp.]